MPLFLPNDPKSLWNLKLKLIGSQLTVLTYGHPLCIISISKALWSPSIALYIPITLPNEL